jgi:hypothetical protein
MRSYHLELSGRARAELEHVRNHDRRPYLRETAAALLKVADGEPARHVALHGLNRRRKPETVYRWLAKYEAGGLAALVHRPRGHRGFPPSAGGGVGRPRPPGSAHLRAGEQPLATG